MIVDKLYKSVLKEAFSTGFKNINFDNKSFGEVFNIINGFTPLRSDQSLWSDDEVNWFTVDDFNEQGTHIKSTRQHISSKAIGNNTNRVLPANTVILCCTSATIGTSAICDVPMATNQQFNGLVPKKNFEIDSEYLYYYTLTLKTKMIADSTSTTFPFLSVKNLEKYLFPYTSLENQKYIANKIKIILNKLYEIKPLEDELDCLKKNFSKNIKKSILISGMTGNLTKNFPDEKKIEFPSSIFDDKIPMNWTRVKAKEILNITTGKKDANYGKEGGEYKFYTCANIPIQSPTYSFEGKNLVLPGNGANVGLTIYTEEKFEAYQRTYVVNSKYDEKSILLKYVYYYFCAFWSDYNKDKMFGSAIPYIKLGNLQNFEINIPPIEEQERIVNKIERLLPLFDEIDVICN